MTEINSKQTDSSIATTIQSARSTPTNKSSSHSEVDEFHSDGEGEYFCGTQKILSEHNPESNNSTNDSQSSSRSFENSNDNRFETSGVGDNRQTIDGSGGDP